jgi:hypothetical protein
MKVAALPTFSPWPLSPDRGAAAAGARLSLQVAPEGEVYLSSGSRTTSRSRLTSPLGWPSPADGLCLSPGKAGAIVEQPKCDLSKERAAVCRSSTSAKQQPNWTARTVQEEGAYMTSYNGAVIQQFARSSMLEQTGWLWRGHSLAFSSAWGSDSKVPHPSMPDQSD